MKSFKEYLTEENNESFFHAVLVSGNPDNHNHSIIAHGGKRFKTPEEALEHIKIYSSRRKKNDFGDAQEAAVVYKVVDGVGEKHSVESV